MEACLAPLRMRELQGRGTPVKSGYSAGLLSREHPSSGQEGGRVHSVTPAQDEGQAGLPSTSLGWIPDLGLWKGASPYAGGLGIWAEAKQSCMYLETHNYYKHCGWEISRYVHLRSEVQLRTGRAVLSKAAMASILQVLSGQPESCLAPYRQQEPLKPS